MNETQIVDIVGWIGAGLVILAYALVSIQKVESKSVAYQLMNLIGGILLIISSIYVKFYQSVLINVIWVAVAIISILVSRTKKEVKE